MALPKQDLDPTFLAILRLNCTSAHQIREQTFPENHHPTGIIKTLPWGSYIEDFENFSIKEGAIVFKMYAFGRNEPY